MTKASKRLVIDACVAGASGSQDATHPTAKNCRDFLQAVLSICHTMVLTTAIAEEWNRHQSRFARAWRTSMFARKKIVVMEIVEDRVLRSSISRASKSQEIADIVLKDCHLVEAALATDRLIASVETTAFGHLITLSGRVRQVRTIRVVNPDDPSHDAISWLMAGAPVIGVQKSAPGDKPPRKRRRGKGPERNEPR